MPVAPSRSSRSYTVENAAGDGRDVVTGTGRGRATSALATSAGATSSPSRPVTPSMVTLSGTTVSPCASINSTGRPAVESVTTATLRADMPGTLAHQAGAAALTWNGVPCMQ